MLIGYIFELTGAQILLGTVALKWRLRYLLDHLNPQMI